MKYPIVIETIPDNFSSVGGVFDKYVNVFGIHIFGTLKTPNNKVLHASNVMAQYLDNNGDGVVDNTLVVKNMLNAPGKNNSKRILCLHGGGGNKNSLKTYQKGMIDLIDHPDLKNSEFVFAESPLINGAWYNDPKNKQTPTTSKDHASESVKYLDDFINKNGPFDTILGFSQGVPMALIYLARGQKKNTDTIQKALLFNGYLPTTHSGLMEVIKTNTYNQNILIYVDKNDSFFDLGKDLKKEFDDALYIEAENAGHFLPNKQNQEFSRIVKYLCIKLQSAIFMSFDDTDASDMRKKLSEISEKDEENYIKQIEMVIHGGGQDLYATETGKNLKNQQGMDMFDASLEEILHLISSNGYANAYPEIFGENKDSEIAKLMDEARGGYYTEVPDQYPDTAWYTYSDTTCDYKCQTTEYFYWGLLTHLNPNPRDKSFWKHRGNDGGDLDVEWKIKKTDGTLMTLKERDPKLFKLLNNNYALPKIIPDGNYVQQEKTYLTKSQIETKYKEAYDKIYAKWGVNFDAVNNQRGRNILLDLYNSVPESFSGTIKIVYQLTTPFYKGSGGSYGYTPYVPPPAPTPAPAPKPTTKTETFNFTKSDIYTDIAYSYRVESEASNDMEIYKHNIIHFYEMALHMDSENWRPTQYYGIYFAKMKNIEKAQEYLKKLKSIIDKKGGDYDRSGDEWYNAVNHFEKEINKALSSRLKTYKKNIIETIGKDRENPQLKYMLNEINGMIYKYRDLIEETTETKIENIKKMKKFTELTISVEELEQKKINFDFIVVGGGPSGIMCAHRLSKLNPNKKIAIFEKSKKTINDYLNRQYDKIKNWILASGDRDYVDSFDSKPDSENGNKQYQIQLGKGIGGGTLHFGLQYIDQPDVVDDSTEYTAGSDIDIYKDIHDICKTKSYNYNDMPFVLSNLRNMLIDNSNNNYNIYNNKIYSRDLENRFLLYDILKDKKNVSVFYDMSVSKLFLDKVGINKDKNIVNALYLNNKGFGIGGNSQVILCTGALETPSILQRSLVIKQETLEFINKINGNTNLMESLVDLPVGETLYDHGGVSLVYLNREETMEKKKVILNDNFLKKANEILNDIYVLYGINIPNENVGVIWDFSDWIREYNIDLKEMHRIVKNSILTYDREIWNWNTEKPLLKKIGVYGSEVFYDDFPEYLKNNSDFKNAFSNGFGSKRIWKYNKNWNINNKSVNQYKFPEDVDEITKKTIIGDLKNLEKTIGNYGEYYFYGFLKGGFSADGYSRLVDEKNPSYLLYLELLRSVNYGRKNYANYYKYQRGKVVFEDLWRLILDLGQATSGLYMDPKNINSKNKQTGIKIIYQGLNVGFPGADELTTIRLNIVKQYFDMYYRSQQLEKAEESIIPENLLNEIKEYFSIYWAEENNIKKNGNKITLKNTLRTHNSLWRIAYLLSLSKNNFYLLYNRFIKEISDSKDWKILFKQIFDVAYDTFIKNYQEFMKKDLTIRLNMVNTIKIPLTEIFQKKQIKRTKKKLITQVSSNIIGHIQTRDESKHWQSYYSLIPFVNQQTFQVDDNLQPIIILTCAESTNMKNNGFVQIPNLDIDNPKNPRVCLKYNIDDIYDAFITNHNAIVSGNNNNKPGEYYLTDPSLNILLNSKLQEDPDVYGIDVSGIKKHFKKNYLTSIYHYHGSCPVYSVVDKNQKVISFNNLSIGDLSVMTKPFAGSTSVAAMVCGYKCANHLSEPMTRELKTNNFQIKDAFLKYTGFERNKIPVLGGENGEKTMYCRVEAEIIQDTLFVRSNGVPNYKPSVGGNEIVGSWNDELQESTDKNPNHIGEQGWVFEIPVIDPTVNPVMNSDDDMYKVVNTSLDAIGVASNGVPFFNPWHNTENTFLSKTRDATTFATFNSCCGHPARGNDKNGGPYHYHKYPTCVAGNMGLSQDNSIIEEENMADVLDARLQKKGKEGHSPILGYMLDGYPVYGPIGTSELVYTEDTQNRILTSSYKLNDYENEYEYVRGFGDLDKCNAIYSATPEYPLGCYHYVLSIEKNSDGTCKRTVNDLYIYKNTKIPMITTSYPHTTLFYRGRPTKAKNNNGTSKKPKRKPDRARTAIDVNEFKNGLNIKYTKNGNKYKFDLNETKEYGVYCEAGDFVVKNGKLTIDASQLSSDTDIYIWEKEKKINLRSLDIDLCKYNEKKLMKRKKTRSFAGIKYLSRAEHEKLPHLVRSILGTTVWANNTLYVILTTDYGEWTDNEKFLIDSALKEYQKVSKLEFIYTDDWDLADIEIKRNNVHPTDKKIVGSSWGPTVYGTEINIYVGAYRSNYNKSIPKGGYIGGWDYATFVHELGHSLGLMHPHEAIEGSIRMKNVFYNPMSGKFILNNRANAFPFTVMSYNDITSVFTPNNTINYGFMNTLGPIDIAAIQAVYGVNENYNAKDNIYKLTNENTLYAAWNTIYDTGGIDEINAEDAVSNVLINLKSSDLNNDLGKKLHLSKAENIWGGFSIFSQSKIENVVAGKYDDIIVENEVENIIDGRKGNDIVYAMDTIDNYLLIRDSENTYSFINVNNDNEKNTLKNIEFIIYSSTPTNITQKLDELENVVFPATKKGVHIKIKK